MKDMVSIVLPVYNRQDYIEECIRSVQAQSHQNFEILVIDNNSADDTLSICQALAGQDSRIKLLSTPCAGVSSARNRGLEAAQGDYVFFLDSDDVIHPLLLETLVKGMQESSAKMAGTGVASVPENQWHKVRERLQQPPTPGETTPKSHEETLYALFHGKSPFGMIGGVMIRRDYIGDTRFCTDLFIGEDYYFVYQNLIKGTNTVFLKDKKWYYARNHKNNTSWNWGYDGFWTRFYRRQLVWESEEAFGRREYANIQKIDAFSCFTNCLRRNRPNSEDARKMCRKIREYRSVLFPAFTYKQKLFYLLSAYTPALYLKIVSLMKKLKS